MVEAHTERAWRQRKGREADHHGMGEHAHRGGGNRRGGDEIGLDRMHDHRDPDLEIGATIRSRR